MVARRQIDCHCPTQADAKTALLRKAVEDGGGTWRDVTALPERDLAALVREDGVDVLVELTGHTAHNRLGVMALRPAPVQVWPAPSAPNPVHYHLSWQHDVATCCCMLIH